MGSILEWGVRGGGLARAIDLDANIDATVRLGHGTYSLDASREPPDVSLEVGGAAVRLSGQAKSEIGSSATEADPSGFQQPDFKSRAFLCRIERYTTLDHLKSVRLLTIDRSDVGRRSTGPLRGQKHPK